MRAAGQGPGSQGVRTGLTSLRKQGRTDTGRAEVQNAGAAIPEDVRESLTTKTGQPFLSPGGRGKRSDPGRAQRLAFGSLLALIADAGVTMGVVFMWPSTVCEDRLHVNRPVSWPTVGA